MQFITSLGIYVSNNIRTYIFIHIYIYTCIQINIFIYMYVYMLYIYTTIIYIKLVRSDS